MKNFSKLTILLLAAVALASCQNSAAPGGRQGYGISKETGGTVIGAVAGGILGAQVGKGNGKVIATSLGAVAGALVGRSVGETLDQYDQEMMQRTSRQALEFSPSGRAVEWHNPDSGNSGIITPTKTYKTSEGMYCREYTQEVKIGGQVQAAYGKACRQSDGTWQIVR